MATFLKKKPTRPGKSSSKDGAAEGLRSDWMNLSSSSSSSSSVPADAARQRQDEAQAAAEADRKRLLNVNRYAAGGGAPAFTKMRKQEQSRLEKMQNQTFTRWVNLQFQNASAGSQTPAVVLPDLVQGLASGDNLLRLLAILSGKNPHATAHAAAKAGGAASRFQSLEHVEQAFAFMRAEGIPLVGIGPQDVAQGNLKLILGMLWSVIQHYRLAHLFDAPQVQPQAQAQPQPQPQAQAENTQAVANEVKEEPKQQQQQQRDEEDHQPKQDKKDKKKDKKGKKEDKKENQDKDKDSKKQASSKTVATSAAAVAATPTTTTATATVAPVSAAGAPAGARAQPQASVEQSLLEWAREKLAVSSPQPQPQTSAGSSEQHPAVAASSAPPRVHSVKELFADGRALPALVNAIHPGAVDVKALDIKRPVENNKLALRAATERLAVPALLEGDDLANGADVDGLSLILYLSYLKQADGARQAALASAPAATEGAAATPTVTKAAVTDAAPTSPAPPVVDVPTEVPPVADAKRPEEPVRSATAAADDDDEKPGEAAVTPSVAPVAEKASDEKMSIAAAAPAVVAPAEVKEAAVADEQPSVALASPVVNADVTSSTATAAAETAKAAEPAIDALAGEKTATTPKSAAVSPEAAAAPVETSKEEEAKEEDKSKDEGEAKKKKKKEKKAAKQDGEDGDKKKKKTKKAKKEKPEKKKKKKKEKGLSSSPSLAGKQEADGQQTAAEPAPATTTTAAAAAAEEKKRLAPLPHSRIPGAPTEDLSYLVGGTRKTKMSLELAPIPERKKAPPKPAVNDAEDPVSAFWYS